MPELPEVEAVCRKLQRDACGSLIVRTRMLRKRDRSLEARTRGRRITEIRRRAKNVLIHLDDGWVVRAHLRMTGNLYVIEDVRFRSDTVRAYFELEGGQGLVFDDPRALGVLEIHRESDLEELLSRLGPEPLGEVFTASEFVERARLSRRPVKLYLLDQTKVAGLGNIYAAEVLHRARLHPARPMNRISRQKLEHLHAAIVGVLKNAVESTCYAYTGPGNYNSEENFPVAVYGREGHPCPECSRPIRRMRQGGRSTYYCAVCQR